MTNPEKRKGEGDDEQPRKYGRLCRRRLDDRTPEDICTHAQKYDCHQTAQSAKEQPHKAGTIEELT